MHDRGFRKKHAQRGKRKDRDEQEARDETEVVQHEFQRIREHGWIRSQEPRPKNPEPRKNDQRPDDDFAAEEIGEKGQGS